MTVHQPLSEKELAKLEDSLEGDRDAWAKRLIDELRAARLSLVEALKEDETKCTCHPIDWDWDPSCPQHRPAGEERPANRPLTWREKALTLLPPEDRS